MKKYFQKIKYQIRTIFLFCFIFIIIVMSANLGLLNMQYRNILVQINESYNMMYLITDFSEVMDALLFDVTGYYDVSSFERSRIRQQYDKGFSYLNDILGTLKVNTTSTSRYYLIDIGNIISTLNNSVQEYFSTVDSSSLSIVYIRQQVSYIERLKRYIDDEINRLSNSILQDSKDNNESFKRQRTILEIQMVTSTVAIILLCFTTAVLFSRFLTNPIKNLASRMKSFDASDPDRSKYKCGNIKIVSQEVDSLVKSYDKMTNQIYELIDELTQKAEIERQLNQQRVDNLEIKSLLHKTELQMLQMQINPHFLFNTLNSIHALAVIDNSEKTAQMIGSLAKILRYALRELDRQVPLSEELENVRNYIELQKMRFGKRIEFHVNYNDWILNNKVPGMIVQPLIENSIMHGFDQEGMTGSIWLTITDEIDFISICVRDNGVGMDEETLKSIISFKSMGTGSQQQNENVNSEKESKLDTHSIGLDNVIRRMHLMYGDEAFKIESSLGKGTTIVLRIAKIEVNTSVPDHSVPSEN